MLLSTLCPNQASRREPESKPDANKIYSNRDSDAADQTLQELDFHQDILQQREKDLEDIGK